MIANRSHSTDLGITLLEMLIVLAILAIVLAVSVPSLRRAQVGNDLGRDARELLAAMQAARTQAIRSSRSIAIFLDADRSAYWWDGSERRVMAGQMTVSNSLAADGDNVRQVRFLPDGSSNAGTIAIRQGRRRDVITVDWPTGVVSMSRSD